MDRETRRMIEQYRRTEAGPLENNLIDEMHAGDLDRSEFLRRGAMFGLSAGIVGSLLAAAGEAGAATGSGMQLAQVKAGGILRAGVQKPAGPIEPYLLNDGGALCFTGIPCEYLTFSNVKGEIVPWLATSWKTNADASVWTFQIRKGVKFHNGKTMTAADVVASFKQYVTAKGTNTGLKPYYDADGVSAKGPYTVVFRLKAPIGGAFPYLVSQTTYQAPVQTAEDAAKPGQWAAGGFVGTGPFKVTKYVDGVSAVLVRNPSYWGGKAPLDGVKITFFASSAALSLSLRAGQIDLGMQLSAQEARPFKNNKKFNYYEIPSSAHRMFCMRTDQGVLKDPRVRRAVALAINRPQQLQKIELGSGQVGNDNPLWRGFKSSDPSVKQRTQNIQLAKALLKAAGAENLKFTLTTWNFLDHPDHAASIQAYARQAGIDISLEIMDGGKYYDSEPAGADYATTTPWLNRTATLTEYGARGVPNVYITRAYLSTGIGDWNASHYNNPDFDSAAKAYLGSAELSAQRKASKRMAGILLRDTPVVTDYFINYTTAGSSKVKNYVPEGLSHMRLAKVGLG